MTRGNNRNIIFKEKEDYVFYLSLISKYKKEHSFDLYHYCLMPNHIHLLIQTNKATDFPIFMKKLNLAYHYYFKKKYGWTGYLWQGRFKSKPVGKDEYFIQCGKYIELNPTRANITKDPQEYLYSSYNYYSQGREDELTTDNFYYEELGKDNKERQLNYQNLLIDKIIKRTYNKEIWGSDSQRYKEKRKIKRRIN
ncbi:transposase [Patescibacteria group bacterium]|nr:transposase [Patescibacteria group bacterium]